jgi:replicative DNA helicase
MQASTPLMPDAPPAPAGHPAIPADLLTLWQGDRATLTARECHQLTMLVSELDAPTSGHGAYWVGRAILIAPQTAQQGVAELHIAKNRHGPTGVVMAQFDGPTTRFASLERGRR